MGELQQLAKEASQWFTLKKRAGTEENIVVVKDDAPQWVTDLCRAAHAASGDDLMLPDDWRYQFIEAAVDALAENDDVDEAQDQATEPDIYTHELTGWLHSTVSRVAYLDEALGELAPKDGSNLLSYAQYIERREVFDHVRAYLEEKVEEDTEEDAEDAGVTSAGGTGE